MTKVHTATEDALSEAVACRLICDIVPNGEVGLKLRKGGFGYLKSNIEKFIDLSKHAHVLLLSDLDMARCAPRMINSWLNGSPCPDRLHFRIPVREIETWLLADRSNFAKMLGVSEAKLPPLPDDLHDPKQTLLNIAKQSAKSVRSELVNLRGGTSSQGLGYNNILANFVEYEWNILKATERSPSLKRAVARLSLIK